MTGNEAIIQILGASNVTITGLNISGPGPYNSHSIEEGILVSGGSQNVHITNNSITEIHDLDFQTLNGASINGWAVRVTSTFDTNATQQNSAFIQNNFIDDYQKAGIFAEGLTTSVYIQNNQIIGIGSTSALSQAGIDIESGAKAPTIMGNTITGNEYSGSSSNTDPYGQGIYFNHAGAANVMSNTLYGNGHGVMVQNSTANILLMTNTIANNDYDGVTLLGASNVVMNFNTVVGNTDYGLYVDSASTGNMFTNNTFSGNGIYDIYDLSTGGSGPGGTNNTYTGNHVTTTNPTGQY